MSAPNLDLQSVIAEHIRRRGGQTVSQIASALGTEPERVRRAVRHMCARGALFPAGPHYWRHLFLAQEDAAQAHPALMKKRYQDWDRAGSELAGLKHKLESARNRVAEAKQIGWPALEQSWLKDVADLESQVLRAERGRLKEAA